MSELCPTLRLSARCTVMKTASLDMRSSLRATRFGASLLLRCSLRQRRDRPWLASQRQSPAVGTAQACRQSLHTRTPAILNALRRDIETFEQFQGPSFETSATNFFASVTFCRATAFARDCCIARRTRTHVRLQAIPASSWRHSNATSFDSRGSRLAGKRTDTRTYGTSRSSPAGTPTRTPAAARGYQSGFDRRCRGRD